jgi:hypothetical protein
MKIVTTTQYNSGKIIIEKKMIVKIVRLLTFCFNPDYSETHIFNVEITLFRVH